MKKHVKLIVLILLIVSIILGIIIYNNVHYSKEDIISIINRSNEKFDNIYIRTETTDKTNGKITIDEIYSKDNIIYYNLSSNFISNLKTEIWNLEKKEKLVIDHTTKEIRNYSIKGERKSKSCNRHI